MEAYNKQFISINADICVEIHHNPGISNKPYLIKIFSYEGYTEHRLDNNDLLNLAESLADFALNNSSRTIYNEHYNGLCMLWHHRRNEALQTIEKLENKLNHYEQDNPDR